MEIQGTEIQIKDYKGKRVVTFKDIDLVHKRPIGTASRNFRHNRDKFISGVDFYKINQPDEIRRLGLERRQGGTPSETVLITETGYLMLVKSFTDDLAWKVQRELVDSYFRAREEPEEQIMQHTMESGVPTVVVATDKLIKCAEIMAGCLDGNRPYVLNILKHIVPNIENQKLEEVNIDSESEPITVPDITEKVTIKEEDGSYSIAFNAKQFNNYLITNEISSNWLAKEIGVARTSIFNWQTGEVRPTIRNRRKLCEALNLPIGYFDNNRRVRRI